MQKSFLQGICRIGVLTTFMLSFSFAALAAAGTEKFSYDARGRLEQVTYPDGSVIRYTYDAAGNRKFSGNPPPSAFSFAGCSSQTPTLVGTPSSITCTLSYSGAAPTDGITYASTLSGMAIAGPTSCAANATCGTVTLSTPTTLGTYAGTLTAESSDGRAPASVNFNLAVRTPPSLTLTACSANSPTVKPAAASETCVVGNTGQTSASGIQYKASTGALTVSSGPATCAANTVNCGSVTVTTGTAAGTYSGTLTATPAVGSPASQAISLMVNNPTLPNMQLGSCTITSPTTYPTAATAVCPLSNAGQTAATLTYSFTPDYGGQVTPVISVPSSCAATASCTNVSIGTGGTYGNVQGILTITPNTGTGAFVHVALSEQLTPAVLALSSCTLRSPTTSPTVATFSCTVSNTGQTAVSSISYITPAGTTVSGPTGSCAGNATCGTVTVSTGTSPGTFSGTLTATPNSGTPASQAVSLTINPSAPILSLSACTVNSPTTSPTAATLSCTLSNAGQTSLSSIAYSTPSGTIVNGPTGACGAGANCGTVTVTTGTTAGTYSGTLTATPNTGSAASQSVNLVVNAIPPIVTLSSCSVISPTTTPTAASMSCSVKNTGQATLSSISYGTPSGTSVSGPTGACAGGATCGTVTVTTSTSVGTYSGTLTATPNTGTAASQAVSLVVNNPTPPNLQLGACTITSPTTSPTAATAVCPLSNAGQTTASSVVYSFSPDYGGQMTPVISVPTSCAASQSCGNLSISTGASGYGNVQGTLTVTPNSGTGTTVHVALSMQAAPPSVTYSGSISSTTTSPTAASGTVTFSNSSQTATTLTLGVTGGGSLSSSSVNCPASGTCTPSVAVTSPTSAGTYNGQLTVSSSAGGTVPAPIAVNLTVQPAAPTVSTSIAASYVTVGGSTTFSWTAGNASSSSATCSGGVSGSGPGSSTGGSITVTGVSAGTGTCVATVNGPGGTVTGQRTTTVVAAPSVTSASFSPTSIANGGTSSFTWSTSNATSASVSCAAPASGSGSGTSGTISVSTTGSGTGSCTVTASNAAGSTATGSANLTINPGITGTLTEYSTTTHTANGSSNDVATFYLKNTGSGTITSVSWTCSGQSFHQWGASSVSSVAPGGTFTAQCQSAASGGYNAAKIAVTGTNMNATTFGPQ